MMRPCCILYSLLFVLVGLAGLTSEAQAQLEVFNDYWVQPEVYSLPGAPNPPTVDAKGDLHLQIPLLTVPGRDGLDYPISLSYTSGIKVSQEASWVGLGWEFNPGSVTRDPQGGAVWNTTSGVIASNVDFPEDANPFLPDAFFVSIPGQGTVPFVLSAGTSSTPGIPGVLQNQFNQWERGFELLEWRPWTVLAEESTGPIQPDPNNSVGITGRHSPGSSVQKNDYAQFVVATEDGTRYVFANPTLASFDGLGFYSSAPARITDYYVSAWRLVAILGADYYSSSLVPDPATNPSGSWVVLNYSDVGTYMRSADNLCDISVAPPQLLQKTYLRSIETPTHVARFNASAEGGIGGCLAQNAVYPDEALESIDLYHRGENGAETFVRSVRLGLDSGHFERYGGSAYDEKRRGLTNIQFYNSAGEEEPGYQFEYATPNPNPDNVFNEYEDLCFYSEDYPVDDFGFFTCRANGGYEQGGAGNFPGRHSTEQQPDLYPESSAWSLTSTEYPSGVKEEYTYEHDVIDAGSHYVANDFEEVEVGIPYANVEGSNTSGGLSNQEGGMYWFKCGSNCPSSSDPSRRGQHQGGIRVKRIARSASLVAALPSPESAHYELSEYKYYRSKPSGIPQGYFQRIAANNGAYFNSASRGGAAVYYEGIERTDSPSGTITTNYYTTPLIVTLHPLYRDHPPLVKYTRTAALRWDGPVTHPDHLTVISDNQSRLWGRRWKTLTVQPYTDDVPYSHSISYNVERLHHQAGRQIMPQVRFDRVRYDGVVIDSYPTIDSYWGYADDVVIRADTSFINGGNMVGTKTIYLRDTNTDVPTNFVDRTIVMRPDQEYPIVTERTYAYDLINDPYVNLRNAHVLTPVVREDVYEGELGGELARGVSAPSNIPTHRFFESDADSLRLFGPAVDDNSPSGREFGDFGICVGVGVHCVDAWEPPGDDSDPDDHPMPTVNNGKHHRSSVTTWQLFPNLPVWKPYRSYQWVAPTSSVSQPGFTEWDGGIPGSEWKLQEEFEEYDAHGRPVKVRNADDGWVELTYGGTASASLTGIAAGEPGLLLGNGENSLSQSFEYGSIGQLVSRTDENDQTWRYRYDEGGRLYETADPLGRVTESVAYKLDAPQPQDAPRFVETVTYPNGNLIANGSFEAYEAGSTVNGELELDPWNGELDVDAWSVSVGGQAPLDDATYRPVLGRRTLALEVGEYAEQTVEEVKTGQELVLSFWARGSTSAVPSVRLTGPDLVMLDHHQDLTPVTGQSSSHTYDIPSVSVGWTRFWVHFRKTSDGPVSIRLMADNNWPTTWDAVSLTPVTSGLSGDELQDALEPRVAVAFADEVGNILQTVDANSWYIDAVERVNAVDISHASTSEINNDDETVIRYHGRIDTAWLPYELETGDWAGNVYDGDVGDNAEAYYSATGPGPDASNRPYVKNTYYPGNSDRTLFSRLPGATEGTRETTQHWYRPRRLRVQPGEYLLLHEDETIDLDGRQTVTYSDMNGDPIITHSFASVPDEGWDLPENIDITNMELSGTDTVSDEWDIPLAPVTQYVPYDLTMTVNEGRKAYIRFSVVETNNDGTTESLVYEGIQNFGRGDFNEGGSITISGGFIAFKELQYKIRVTLSANQIWSHTPPEASITGTIRFRNDDGTVPMLIRTRFKRDALGQVTAVESPNAFAPPQGSIASNWVSTYLYDTAGRVLRTTTPDNGVVRFAYDAGGKLRYSQDANQAAAQPAKVMAFCYDGLGRLLRQGLMDEFGGGFIAHLAEYDPDGACPTVDWHLVNRYDEGGDLTVAPFEATSEVISAVSSPSANTTGKLVASAFRSDDVWQASFFTYDAVGNLAQQWTRIDGVDPEWQSTAYTYDAVGNVTEERVEVGAQALTQFYTYDGRGQLHRVYAATDGADSATERPAEPDAEYTYDVRGGLIHTALGGSTGAATTEIARQYDVRGRLTDIGDVDGSQTAWNGQGSSPANPAAPFAARLEYTPGGLIARATALSPYATLSSSFGDDADSPLWQYRFSYDTMGRLTGAEHFAAADFGALSSKSTSHQAFDVSNLTYDANGNLLSLTRRAPTDNYPDGTEIDKLVTGTADDQPGYEYVTGTNRLEEVHDAASAPYSHDAKPTTFLYDDNGNVTAATASWGGQSYTTSYTAYDDRNLPLVVEAPDGSGGMRTLRYRYDAAGQRILRVTEEAGATTFTERYVRSTDGATVGLFNDLSGGIKHWNIRGLRGSAIGRIPAIGLVIILRNQELSGTYEAIDRIEAEAATVASTESLVLRAGSEVVLGPGFEAPLGTTVELEAGIEVEPETDPRRYYVADHLGSVRAVVQASGEMVEARDYYPFGLEMPGRGYVAGEPTKEGYTGHELDMETGHYYAGARYYMPALGLWTTTDPLNEYASPYIYVGNNPISLIDPTGMSSEGGDWLDQAQAYVSRRNGWEDADFGDCPDGTPPPCDKENVASTVEEIAEGLDPSFGIYSTGATFLVAAETGQMYHLRSFLGKPLASLSPDELRQLSMALDEWRGVGSVSKYATRFGIGLAMVDHSFDIAAPLIRGDYNEAGTQAAGLLGALGFAWAGTKLGFTVSAPSGNPWVVGFTTFSFSVVGALGGEAALERLSRSIPDLPQPLHIRNPLLHSRTLYGQPKQ